MRYIDRIHKILGDDNSLVALQRTLNEAARKLDIVCHDFGVSLEPSWVHIVDKVLDNIRSDKKAEKEVKPVTVFYLHPPIHSSYVEAGRKEDILDLFREKFKNLVKKSVIPALKAYCKEHPEVKPEMFRPLLTVDLKI